jgi:hypothetical protein
MTSVVLKLRRTPFCFGIYILDLDLLTMLILFFVDFSWLLLERDFSKIEGIEG